MRNSYKYMSELCNVNKALPGQGKFNYHNLAYHNYSVTTRERILQR